MINLLSIDYLRGRYRTSLSPTTGGPGGMFPFRARPGRDYPFPFQGAARPASYGGSGKRGRR